MEGHPHADHHFGNHSSGSNRRQGSATYGYRSADQLPHGTFHSIAPPSYSVGELGFHHHAYPRSESGPLSTADVNPYQPPAPEEFYKGNNLNLDNLNLLDTGTLDSGYQTSVQSRYPYPTIGIDTTNLDLLSTPPNEHLDHREDQHMPPISPQNKDNDSLDYIQSNRHLLENTTSYHDMQTGGRGKRSRESQTIHDFYSGKASRRSTKFPRLDRMDERSKPNHPHDDVVQAHSSRRFSRGHGASQHYQPQAKISSPLTKKQKTFIRQWHESFAKQAPRQRLATEDIHALARLILSDPQPIREYIHRKFNNDGSTRLENSQSLIPANQPTSHASGYSFAQANGHLPADVLEFVEKYILASHRLRSRNDGRRSVNDGPLHCTFGCGYRTKRPFDWRRHEETHEPQELWLCYLCHRQTNVQNPFLVNRRDKFLSHVKKTHKVLQPEEVVERSKLVFHANFDPKCPMCSDVSDSWDSRCKHILAHYEDESIGGAQEMSAPSGSVKRAENTSDGQDDDLGSSESSDLSDGEESNDDDPNAYPDKRDPTGGAGGGSGTTRGPSTYRDNGSFHGGNGTEGHDSMGPFYNIPFTSFVHDKTTQGGSSIMKKNDDRVYHMMRSETGWQAFLSLSNHASERTQIIPGIAKPSQGIHCQDIGSTLAVLGHGSHGIVDTIREHLSGKVYARKRSSHRSFPMEIEILKRLTHPHIIKFIAAYYENSSLNLIMSPIAHSTLQDFLVAPTKPEYSLDQAHVWIGCLSSALSYIHSQNIRHADLKPNNLLLKGSEIFITDFGISRPVSEADSTSSSISPSTPLYAPLEIAEHLPHGRKADIFSLGCVVLEVLSYVQGKGYTDLYQHLGFTKRNKQTSQDPFAYYRVQGKLLSWISLMRRHSSLTTRKLWDICECMLQNQIDLRPSAILLLEQVRQTLQDGNVTTCQTCIFGPKRIQDVETSDSEDVIASDLPLSCTDKLSERIGLHKPAIQGNAASHQHMPPLKPKTKNETALNKQEELKTTTSNSCLVSTGKKPIVLPCVCSVRKKRPSVLLGLLDILTEYEHSTIDTKTPNLVTDAFTFQIPPPAYHDSPALYPVSISIPTDLNQPHALAHVAHTTNHFGKVGMKHFHGTRHPRPPSSLARRICHQCGTKFVAPRLEQCRLCSHIRCEKCPVIRAIPDSEAESSLAGIGSHLHPPPYKDIPDEFATGEPLTEVQVENTVLNLVIAESSSLGTSVQERFIEERPSTFDRLHLREHNPNSRFISEQPASSPIVDVDFQHRGSDSNAPPSISLTTQSTGRPQSNRAKPDNRERLRLDRRKKRLRLDRQKNRQFVSGRSKQSVHIKQSRAMNDHTPADKLDCQDLTSRFRQIQRSTSEPNDGDYVSRITRSGVSRTAFSDDSSCKAFARLPSFRKGKMPSTVGNNEMSQQELVQALFTPSSTNEESVEVEQGEFNKPHVRRHSGTHESSKTHKEFQRYGRHSNTWLFNDFSLSDQVKKGFGKVFSGKNDGEE